MAPSLDQIDRTDIERLVSKNAQVLGRHDIVNASSTCIMTTSCAVVQCARKTDCVVMLPTTAQSGPDILLAYCIARLFQWILCDASLKKTFAPIDIAIKFLEEVKLKEWNIDSPMFSSLGSSRVKWKSWSKIE